MKFNPENKFYCSQLKASISYYNCEINVDSGYTLKCKNCVTGTENIEKIKIYREKKGERGKDKKMTQGKAEYYEKNLQSVDTKKIYLDFRKHPELFGKIRELAKDNFRNIADQIFFMIKKNLESEHSAELPKTEHSD